MMEALDASMKAVMEDRTGDQTDLKEFLHIMRTEIDHFVGETPQFDDLTMMCLEYRGPM